MTTAPASRPPPAKAARTPNRSPFTSFSAASPPPLSAASGSAWTFLAACVFLVAWLSSYPLFLASPIPSTPGNSWSTPSPPS